MEHSEIIKVLLIEDNIGDAELIEEMLNDVEFKNFNLTNVETLEEGLNYLKSGNFDILLLDLGLPDSNGIQTLLKVHDQNNEIPIIILTGLNDEEVGLDALREGAQDYLVKGNVNSDLLSKSISYSIERNNAEKRLKETIEELERSNDELQQFAYITSHDLQEPLRTITSFTQLMERRYSGKLDKDADEFIDYIVDASVRMKQMILDLLEYSRVGTQGHEFKPVNVDDVLDEVKSNLKSSIDENNAIVTYDHLPTVMADKGQLVQLFQNLISNAIKFKKEDEPPKIHISARKDPKRNEYVFSVADNGIGMEEEYTDKIFEVFKRLHTIDKYNGTGIGLAVVKRIMDRHGGHIWVESQLGKGSTFYFTFPLT